jgi:hypothetical protein
MIEGHLESAFPHSIPGENLMSLFLRWHWNCSKAHVLLPKLIREGSRVLDTPDRVNIGTACTTVTRFVVLNASEQV